MFVAMGRGSGWTDSSGGALSSGCSVGCGGTRSYESTRNSSNSGAATQPASGSTIIEAIMRAADARAVRRERLASRARWFMAASYPLRAVVADEGANPGILRKRRANRATRIRTIDHRTPEPPCTSRA